MQVCTSLQTDNHASTPTTLFFYRPDALPAALYFNEKILFLPGHWGLGPPLSTPVLMGLLHQSNNYKITLASTHNAIVGYIVITLYFPDATEILLHSRAVHMYVFIIHAELSKVL